MVPEPTGPDILYFCDESSQVDDRHMAVGGLAVSRERIPEILTAMWEARERCNYFSEVKWSTAKKRRASIHKDYAVLLRQLVRANHAAFHIRFAPFLEYDHKNAGPRGRIDTVSKMYYQLLLHRPAKYYGDKRHLYIHPDKGDCTSELADMRGALCAGAYHAGAMPDCVKVIEPRDSAREPFLQLLDVTLGAFAARRNDRELGDTKAELRDFIIGLWGGVDLAKSTPMSNKAFNVWNATPQKRGP
jgi:hypothetical protein